MLIKGCVWCFSGCRIPPLLRGPPPFSKGGKGNGEKKGEADRWLGLLAKGGWRGAKRRDWGIRPSPLHAPQITVILFT